LPAGFDFTDPDIYAERLPVAELAEMRKVAPIWWNEQPPDKGGFGDGGYWVVSKHKDVKEVSRRSDVFSSLQKTALPRYADGAVETQIETGRFVLLNMDAPHHTHLRKIVSRAFTPRAVERLRADLAERAREIATKAAAAGVLRTPPTGDRRPDGRAAGRPDEVVPLVQPDGRRHGPRVREQRRDQRLGRTDHLRHAAGGGARRLPR
jgi:hypothetical protein